MSKITKTDSKFIQSVVEAAQLYRPTADQRQIKAEFHAAKSNGPSPERVTAAFAVQLTGRSVIESWWKDDGFKPWFLDATSFENEAEALANAALGVIADVMYRAPKDGDRLSAAKLAVEIAGKIKKNQTEVRFLDENLPDDINQLDEYIRKAGGNLESKTTDKS